MALTPYMNLTLPDVSSTLGPLWATDLNGALTQVDLHNHTSGLGLPVPVAGMNINADFPLNGFNLTLGRSLRMSVQAAALALSTDKGCLFVSGVDLWFNDINGNHIQLTAGGALNAASIGAIGGDYATSTASLAYSSATKTFTFLQASLTPAIIDCGPIFLRKASASSNSIELIPAAGIAADYILTLPAALPASTKLLLCDNAGNLSFGGSFALAGVTSSDAASANAIRDAATRATGTSVGTGGVAKSASSGFQSVGTSFTDITNLSVTITTSGRPIRIQLQHDGVGSNGALQSNANVGIVQFVRGSTALNQDSFQVSSGSSETPCAAFSFIDIVAAGTYTYKVQLRAVSGNVSINSAVLVVYEL